MSLQGDRILKERGKFEIPLSLSGVLWLLSFDTERKQLAPAGATPSLPQAKKKPPLGRKHLYPRVSGRNIYFVRADRRGLIKRKKEAPQKEKSSILSLAVRPEIIKRKKKPPQKNNLYYSSRGSGRVIYLSHPVRGEILSIPGR